MEMTTFVAILIFTLSDIGVFYNSEDQFNVHEIKVRK